jgi:hypothetical protein
MPERENAGQAPVPYAREAPTSDSVVAGVLSLPEPPGPQIRHFCRSGDMHYAAAHALHYSMSASSGRSPQKRTGVAGLASTFGFVARLSLTLSSYRSARAAHDLRR